MFIIYATINLIAAATFIVVVTGWDTTNSMIQVQKRLTDSAKLIASNAVETLSSSPVESNQTTIRQLGRDIETRVTLINERGVVLADSSKANISAVLEMDDHSDRPEIVRAREDGIGASIRESASLKKQMHYLALRINGVDGKPLGYVRTALPSANIAAESWSRRMAVWSVALVFSIVALVATNWVLTWVLRPLGELTTAVDAIAKGNYNHRVDIKNNDELGMLGETLNRMSHKLSTHIEEVHESEGRLAAVLGGMIEGVLAIDGEQRVLFANSAAGRLLKFDSEKVQGKHLSQITDSLELSERLSKADEDDHQKFEIALSGDSIIRCSTTTLTGDSSPVVIVLHDISELRRLEHIRQEFVANVSHELKTPLSSIKAYAETLSAGAIEDPQNRLRFVHHIEEQAERLHQLILDLLSLARIESGQQTYDIEAVVIHNLIQRCVESHQDRAHSGNVALVFEPGDPNIAVSADEEAVREIVDNLINNAVKYTPENGNVSVRYRTEGNMAVIEVGDSGIGISEDDQQRIFERFYRVDKARSREMGGTGLGLSIVKHLTHFFGGTIHVSSVVDEGTIFTVRLPLA
ncbi:MAG: two-component system phosphate regulon sensor histidine kinase PhoR [Pirellulaceae bacterium]|jgi:two-component system phosphate regulon sensor histidine kinase PhoR